MDIDLARHNGFCKLVLTFLIVLMNLIIPPAAPADTPPDRGPAATAALQQNRPGTAAVAASSVAESLWQWSLSAGYRQDELDFSIAGPDVNIISELDWSDIESVQLAFGLQRRLYRHFRLKGELAYGFVFDGDNRDSDYLGNDRTLEFSRSNNSTDDGDLWDLSIGLAYDIGLFADRLCLSPQAGYSYHDQNLRITKGVQTVSDFGFPVPLGPFSGLDSSYDPTWYGPWVGLEFRVNSRGQTVATNGIQAVLGVEYHWADFEAKADWNLRPDLAHPVSFRQDADASGWVLTGSLSYLFAPNWSLDLIGKFQNWKTDAGTHRFLLVDGSSFKTRLNEVNWDSFAASVGISCRF